MLLSLFLYVYSWEQTCTHTKSRIKCSNKLEENWFLNFSSGFSYYSFYFLKQSPLNFESVLQGQLAYALKSRKPKIRSFDTLSTDKLSTLCPLTHYPHLLFYYWHAVPVIILIKQETKQIIDIEPAVSLNSSPKNNCAGHCWCSSLAGNVCQGKRFTQGHPVTQQQLRKGLEAAQPCAPCQQQLSLGSKPVLPDLTASISSAKAQTDLRFVAH